MGLISRLTKVKDGTVTGDFSNGFRSRRFHYFAQLAESLPRPIRILDVGGTCHFWEQRGWSGRDDIDLTLLNLEAEETGIPHIRSIAGDATDLSQYEDDSFDLVFSNSVIEHLFTYENQRAMASECARVGKNMWIQTPNYWFPIEPHFHWLGWQWYPRWVRVNAIQRVNCGHRGPYPDRKEAEAAVDEVRLMSHRELVEAFPGARIWREKLFGLTKSFVVISGF